MIPQPILTHFQNMKPGDVINVWAARAPLQLIWAGKEYIEAGNNDIEFSNDYERIIKLETEWV
jgi:hypothetical protein